MLLFPANVRVGRARNARVASGSSAPQAQATNASIKASF
jgi:hypothetical protein